MTFDQLLAFVDAAGQPAFRARQVWEWVWQKGVYDFAAMTNLSAGFRAKLAAGLRILTGQVSAVSESPDGVTKLLLEWPDGKRVETVLIPSEKRATACVSTQVGCRMGCTFCASGLEGMERNLTTGEMVEQVIQLQQRTGRRVTHVVVMGMGEPLANYDVTVGAIRAIVDPERLGISARRVTLSTVGIPDRIRKLAREDLPITLAISLHAPNDPLRRQIMPAAGKYPIDAIITAAGEYFAARKREVTLEYLLLGGVNDSGVCADALARIAARLRCNVNLIRFNPVPGLPYTRTSQRVTTAFADRLAKHGVNVQIRRSRGAAADAACGQLRNRADEAHNDEAD
jgi:23S rRNA (adenine2503-C2)-methyltransferase